MEAVPHVSTAQSQDLEEIATLVNSAYRGESARMGWTHESHLLGGERTNADLLREEMQAGHHILCLREPTPGNALLGCVALHPHGKTFHLGMLTVRPARQNAKLGQKLMTAAEDFARKKGAERMELSVIQVRAELLAWYERRGYRRTGERKPFPSDVERFPRLTSHSLDFVLMEKLL